MALLILTIVWQNSSDLSPLCHVACSSFFHHRADGFVFAVPPLLMTLASEDVIRSQIFQFRRWVEKSAGVQSLLF